MGYALAEWRKRKPRSWNAQENVLASVFGCSAAEAGKLHFRLPQEKTCSRAAGGDRAERGVSEEKYQKPGREVKDEGV